jgi:hypothetical protein
VLCRSSTHESYDWGGKEFITSRRGDKTHNVGCGGREEKRLKKKDAVSGD